MQISTIAHEGPTDALPVQRGGLHWDQSGGGAHQAREHPGRPATGGMTQHLACMWPGFVTQSHHYEDG